MITNREVLISYQVKRLVTINQILERYGILGTLRRRGKYLVGPCPIHEGADDSEFLVNLRQNTWRCCGSCKTGGNIVHFVATMEGVEMHEAVTLIAEWFNIDIEALLQPQRAAACP